MKIKVIILFAFVWLVNMTLGAQSVGIGTTMPNSKLHITGGSEANLSNGSGYFLLGLKEYQNLVFDDDELQSRNNGVEATLNLNPHGGNLIFGNPIRPTYMNLLGNMDASLFSNGLIVLGSTTGPNLVFDKFNIIARNNGNQADLYLQRFGGNINLGFSNSVTRIQGNDYPSLLSDGALVIGANNLENLTFGSNKIQARNNGSLGNLVLQEHGGDIEIGSMSGQENEVKIYNPRQLDNIQTGGFTIGSNQIITMDDDDIQARSGNSASTLNLQSNGGPLRVGNQFSENLLIISNKLNATNNAVPSNLVLQEQGTISIGASNANQSAILDINSTNKGLLIPRMDSISRTQISAPAQGLLVYQTNLDTGFYYFKGAMWNKLSGGNSAWIEQTTNVFTVKQVGIGTNTPDGMLNVKGGSEATLSDGSGFEIIGDINESNIVFDSDEIQARNNNNAAVLKIQEDGGNVEIGNININSGHSTYLKDGKIDGINNLNVDWSIVIGDKAGNDINVGRKRIQSRRDDFAFPGENIGDDLFLNPLGGYVGIGNPPVGVSPSTNLHVFGGSEASLVNGSGAAIIGNINTANLVIDGDELQARSGGTFSTLKLQEHGGNLTIGNTNSISQIPSIREASLINDGGLVIGDTSNLNIDRDEIQARSFVGANTLSLQPEGGNTKIGNANQSYYTQILGGHDVSPTNEGIFVVGNLNEQNIGFDGNEIMARNNGVSATLVLQNNGGLVNIGSNMRIDSLVGIGMPPSEYKLRLSMDSAAKPGTSGWTIASDGRLKQNITQYSAGLKDLIRINPVKFHYNETSGYDVIPEYVGIIAQELQEVAPYMVGSFSHNGVKYLDVNDSAMTYMLINAVKELAKEQIEMKEILTQLKQNNDDLTTQMDALKSKSISELSSLRNDLEAIKQLLKNIPDLSSITINE